MIHMINSYHLKTQVHAQTHAVLPVFAGVICERTGLETATGRHRGCLPRTISSPQDTRTERTVLFPLVCPTICLNSVFTVLYYLN